MKFKNFSVATVAGLSALLLGLMLLSGCGGGSTPTVAAAAPAVSLSATSLTFSSGLNIQSAAQTVTVTDSGTAELTFSGVTVSDKTFTIQSNTCGTGIAAGTACTITLTFTPASAGSVNATLTITDNASGSPHTVSLMGTVNVNATASLSPTTLTFTGVSVGSSSSPQTVTLTNNGGGALTITNIAATGNFSLSNNTCGTFVAVGGNCTISVTFTPLSSGTLTGTLIFTDNAGGLAGSTQSVALSGSNVVANTAQLTVGFGPNGPGPVTATSEPYFNGIFTSVTVCEPGTTTCQSVPNVLVDTGSVGLRVLATALGNVSLPTISLNGQALNECVGFVDFSYSWGPVAMATVEVGGETASGVPAAAGGTANTGIPIQIISNTSSAPSGAPCISSPTYSYNANTVALLGANGILGIGNTAQDCTYGNANYCDAAATSNAELYITCTNSSCGPVAVPLQQQVWNPVAAFSSGDTNGESLQLPSIPAAGAASATGTMTFGIGTQSNNALPAGTTVYEQDSYNYFGTITYNGIAYTSSNSYGGYIDSGSNGLYILDGTTLNTPDCYVGSTDIEWYCPSSTLNLTLGLEGITSASATNVTVSIANAESLFVSYANPAYAAYNNLGGESGGVNGLTDSIDLGLPFFFGRTIFVGLAGTTVGGTTSTNGYWAF